MAARIWAAVLAGKPEYLRKAEKPGKAEIPEKAAFCQKNFLLFPYRSDIIEVAFRTGNAAISAPYTDAAPLVHREVKQWLITN
jgi:hypothetical protein